MIADGTIAVGTSRLTDLTALTETALGDTLEGALVRWTCMGSLIGTVGGLQSYTVAGLIAPDTLDAADVFPGTTDRNLRWAGYRTMIHRGQQHNVIAAVSEFDEMRIRFTIPWRRQGQEDDSMWLVEEVTGQSQNVSWRINAVVRLG